MVPLTAQEAKTERSIDLLMDASLLLIHKIARLEERIRILEDNQQKEDRY